MVRVGLVVVALALVSLVLAGIGMGMGLVQIDAHGIAFAHKEDAPDTSSGDQPRIVSADDLLRQKHVNYVEPTPQVDAPKPAAPAIAQNNTPTPARLRLRRPT